MAEMDSLVVAAVEAGVLVADDAGRVAQANLQARAILGRDLTGTGLEAGEFEDDLPVVGSLAECYRRAAAQAGSFHDLVVTNTEEGPRYYWVTINPVAVSRAGAPWRAIFMVDVGAALTESPALQRVFSQVNHDLRSPLTSISGAAELLLSGRVGSLEGVQRRLVTIIEEGSRKMGEILARTKTHLAQTQQAAGGSDGE